VIVINVVAVTVAFNRPETLSKTLFSLANQQQLSKIIVVDNGATREVKDVIMAYERDFSSLVDTLETGENTGGAGGFFFGMKYAFEKYKPDWYWIMDDDAYPRKNCLEELLKHTDCSPGFLAPLIFGLGKSKFQIYHHKKMSRFLDKEYSAVDTNVNEMDGQLIELDANAFVGPLISKEAIESLGFPNKELFIYGDDTEYTYRITRRFRSLLVTSAVIDHEDVPAPSSTGAPYHWWKDYYSLRNRLLLIREFERGLSKFSGFSLIFLRVLKGSVAALVKKRYKSLRSIRLRIVLKGFVDGVSGKTGKRIDPTFINEEIKMKMDRSVKE